MLNGCLVLEEAKQQLGRLMATSCCPRSLAERPRISSATHFLGLDDLNGAQDLLEVGDTARAARQSLNEEHAVRPDLYEHDDPLAVLKRALQSVRRLRRDGRIRAAQARTGAKSSTRNLAQVLRYYRHERELNK